MGDYILGIAGIGLSIALFLIGYRKTIGAKKERIRSANAEIEKILVRRIILEEYTPEVEHIARLIDGKARDFRVRTGDILSESQFLNNIFTRVVETDFIQREQREAVLSRLAPVVATAEKQPMIEEALVELPSSRRLVASRTTAALMMGIMASIVGSLMIALPKIGGLETRLPELLPMIIGTAAASLAIIVFIISFYRIREQQQEETSKLSTVSSYVEFERDVVTVLTKAGVRIQAAGARDRGYDLVIDRGGRKVLVEIKAWKRPMTSRIVRMAIDQLREAFARHEDASEAILVTQRGVQVPIDLREHNRVKVMTLRELRNYLVHAAGD